MAAGIHTGSVNLNVLFTLCIRSSQVRNLFSGDNGNQWESFRFMLSSEGRTVRNCNLIYVGCTRLYFGNYMSNKGGKKLWLGYYVLLVFAVLWVDLLYLFVPYPPLLLD